MYNIWIFKYIWITFLVCIMYFHISFVRTLGAMNFIDSLENLPHKKLFKGTVNKCGQWGKAIIIIILGIVVSVFIIIKWKRLCFSFSSIPTFLNPLIRHTSQSHKFSCPPCIHQKLVEIGWKFSYQVVNRVKIWSKFPEKSQTHPSRSINSFYWQQPIDCMWTNNNVNITDKPLPKSIPKSNPSRQASPSILSVSVARKKMSQH